MPCMVCIAPIMDIIDPIMLIMGPTIRQSLTAMLPVMGIVAVSGIVLVIIPIPIMPGPIVPCICPIMVIISPIIPIMCGTEAVAVRGPVTCPG